MRKIGLILNGIAIVLGLLTLLLLIDIFTGAHITSKLLLFILTYQYR